jgi:hypothetical protein
MKITTDSKRIEEAHYILQRLEDEVVGYMPPDINVCGDEERINKVYKNRLNSVHREVLRAIRMLNEAYDASVPKL